MVLYRTVYYYTVLQLHAYLQHYPLAKILVKKVAWGSRPSRSFSSFDHLEIFLLRRLCHPSFLSFSAVPFSIAFFDGGHLLSREAASQTHSREQRRGTPPRPLPLESRQPASHRKMGPEEPTGHLAAGDALQLDDRRAAVALFLSGMATANELHRRRCRHATQSGENRAGIGRLGVAGAARETGAIGGVFGEERQNHRRTHKRLRLKCEEVRCVIARESWH